ncbi:UPF0688 protein C1orf174 homolog isoform X2 [Brienomyrus brachyistius]|uniref:UPF0688 protein C1orf174 homolog isoform X2 n=1 Tax=Brienomyrus brachyistius TaxID=42636 RepID=UPI0020B3743E|nr:UPF0688 protein C1orf174 homolog isoform X2 [Brienomyrus brachyistius]XP_048873269.1 UPF0688 protein C1orf174 homolog isoform X2 [Brienomyrus brachyistius]
MRRKQGRTRTSARLREKQAAASQFQGDGAPKQTSLEAADLQCPVKRPRGKCTERKINRRDANYLAEDGLSLSPVVTNGNGEKDCTETSSVVAGLCSEESTWACLQDRSEPGNCNVTGQDPEPLLDDQDNSIFLDDDSNQIIPVGQFFGNLELVQDYPPRVPLESHISRREYRRLHYIARDDSDEDVYDDPLVTEQENDSFNST